MGTYCIIKVEFQLSRKKIIYLQKWHNRLAIWKKYMSYTKINPRWIPDLNVTKKIKLLGKIRRIINFGMRETFLNRTENSDAINEKADLFDNIQLNIFL